MAMPKKVLDVPADSEKKEAPANVLQEKVAPKKALSQIEETKKILDESPHTNFLLPLAEGEKSGEEPVSINGYTTIVPKGQMVNIPVPVANILADKYKINMTAGMEKRIDRNEAVSNALG